MDGIIVVDGIVGVLILLYEISGKPHWANEERVYNKVD
jgi:hypothetical protein